MRALVPADALVYLETNDLAAALQPIVDSKPFTGAAASKPDLSPLRGVQIAVAVTGLEISKDDVNDEQSNVRVRPRFVAVADTHAWNFQAVRFADEKLDQFVADIYDGEPHLERTDAKGGKYFTWTAPDGRKAYALVIDSLVWFSNDETAIEKSLAVRRGEADSLAKTGKVQPAAAGTLALGHIATDGVAQFAALLAVKFANESKEDSELQTAIADVLPQLLRSSVKTIDWTTRKAEQGVTDEFVIETPSTRDARSDEILTEIAGSITEEIEGTSAEDVARVLAEVKPDSNAANTVYSTENRFTANRVERRTVSDMGFIGWLVAQAADDQ
jgi:hypothetical protein